jgi:hypothetical protein
MISRLRRWWCIRGHDAGLFHPCLTRSPAEHLARVTEVDLVSEWFFQKFQDTTNAFKIPGPQAHHRLLL